MTYIIFPVREDKKEDKKIETPYGEPAGAPTNPSWFSPPSRKNSERKIGITKVKRRVAIPKRIPRNDCEIP